MDPSSGAASVAIRTFRDLIVRQKSSLAELETHLEIGRRLGYFETESLEESQLLTTEVGRMLSTLLRRLRT
jgi:four helix bundle protein